MLTDHDRLLARADGFANARGYGYTAVPLVEDLAAALRATEINRDQGDLDLLAALRARDADLAEALESATIAAGARAEAEADFAIARTAILERASRSAGAVRMELEWAADRLASVASTSPTPEPEPFLDRGLDLEQESPR